MQAHLRELGHQSTNHTRFGAPPRLSPRLIRASAAMQATDLDVAIIGGGPAGLLVSHALSQAFKGKCRVGVFERVPRLTSRGAGFTLLPNGMEALSAISPSLYTQVSQGMPSMPAT